MLKKDKNTNTNTLAPGSPLLANAFTVLQIQPILNANTKEEEKYRPE